MKLILINKIHVHVHVSCIMYMNVCKVCVHVLVRDITVECT